MKKTKLHRKNTELVPMATATMEIQIIKIQSCNSQK